MCEGDDHLAWKRPVSLEAYRGLRIAGGYDRFCQGSFQVHPYLFKATLTSQVEPQILRLRLPSYTWVHLKAFRASLVIVQYSLFQSPIESTSRSVRVWVWSDGPSSFLMPCSFQFRLAFLSCFSYAYHISCFMLFRIGFFILRVDLAYWVRVKGSLVCFFEISDMDQQVVIVDQFTAAMASIREALASLRQSAKQTTCSSG